MLVYQIIKDLFALAKMKETDPIDPGSEDLHKLGIIDTDNGDVYSWIRPHRLFALTEAPGAAHELVWVTDTLRRKKRKVVRFTRNGAVDRVLIRRKAIEQAESSCT